jgi:hypothetical protein
MLAPAGVWGFTTKEGLMYLRGKDGEWYGYRAKKVKPLKPVKLEPKNIEPPIQQQMKGGFFKRF